jgi:hypothetical protein
MMPFFWSLVFGTVLLIVVCTFAWNCGANSAVDQIMARRTERVRIREDAKVQIKEIELQIKEVELTTVLEKQKVR